MKRLFLIVASYLFITTFTNCTAPSSSSYSDSSKIDTTVIDTTLDTLSKEPSVSVDDREKADKLKALQAFESDKFTFDKLYAKARKKGDEFSSSILIQDITSPVYVNRNGIYCVIEKTKDDVTLDFNIQYYADDWLFINNMIFNLDGENFDYTPGEFKRDNGDGMIWEWSTETVSDFDLMAKLATAKTAKVKYNGNQYYKVLKITPVQQKAIKNMLTLYVGFLKGYQK